MVIKMLSAEEVNSQLPYFTGTEQWYKNPLFPKYLYTDGVRFVAESCGAYWLIDKILSNQMLKEVAAEKFQTWELTVSNSKAKLVCEDGDCSEVFSEEIEYTDFPLEGIKFFFTDNVLLLTSEY